MGHHACLLLLLLISTVAAESALPSRAQNAVVEYHSLVLEQGKARAAFEQAQADARAKAEAKVVGELKRALSRRSPVATQAAVYKEILRFDREDSEARAFFTAIGSLEQVLLDIEQQPVAVDLFAGTVPGTVEALLPSLPDTAFSASSGHSPTLFSPFSRYSSASSWSIGGGQKEGWLQVDLGQERSIVAVGTKGRGNYRQWVTSYGLQFSRDGQDWVSPKDAAGKDLVFEGNVDQETERRHDFPRPVVARYVRFLPLASSGYMSMRIEVYGW